MTTDFELLDAWREGDRASGDQLLKRHFEPLCRFFRNKVSDGVDDLIQGTLMSCVEKRDQFRKQSSFRTYLFAIARNELYDSLRRRQRSPDVDFSASSIEDMGTSPSGAVGRDERQRLLNLALRTIPLDFQVCIEMYYWEQLSGPELAAVLGIPANTVRSRLARARRALEDRLEALGLGRDALPEVQKA